MHLLSTVLLGAKQKKIPISRSDFEYKQKMSFRESFRHAYFLLRKDHGYQVTIGHRVEPTARVACPWLRSMIYGPKDSPATQFPTVSSSWTKYHGFIALFIFILHVSERAIFQEKRTVILPVGTWLRFTTHCSDSTWLGNSDGGAFCKSKAKQ